MEIKIKAFPNAKKESVELKGDVYNVRVAAPATDGKANKAVEEAVAEYIGVRKNKVRIIRGFKSRDKLAEVLE